MSDLAQTILLIGLVFTVAGFAKGMLGLGLPTVAMALLGLFMRPAEAAALIVVPSLVTNFWQGAAGPLLPALLRRLWPLAAGIVVGTLAGARLLAGAMDSGATVALGLALLAYAVFGLAALRPSVSPAAERWLAAPVGAATGLVTAATGVFVLPAVPYLQALEFERDALVQALGISFTVSTLALAAALADGGALIGASAGGSVAAVAPSLAGMVVGQSLRRRVAPERFRKWFFGALLVLGLHLAVRPLL